MQTYVMMFQFTPKGIEHIKESPPRVEAAKKIVKNLGGEVRSFYAMLGGPCDTLLMFDAPNDEAVTKMALAIGSLGFVRTDSHRLFNEDEFRKIVAALP